MNQPEKTLRTLLSKPTPTDLTWNELATLFKYLGYEEIKNDGSRRKFVSHTSGRKFFIHKPHPQPTLKVYVVNQIIETLKLHGHI
jgi:predicted RNA binding protein YcfA (HicA-like mRNA interferase family)